MSERIAIISTLSGVLGGVVSALTGGWDLALETLAIVMALDYITGLIVAGVFHKSPKSAGGALESKAAFKGLLKKCLIIVIVVGFHQIDRLTGKSFFRDGACWAFFIAELISVIENVGLVYPLPAFIRKGIEWLRHKDEGLSDAMDAEFETTELASGGVSGLFHGTKGARAAEEQDGDVASHSDKSPNGEKTE